MRTTLDIDPSVLRAAKALAEQRGVSLGAAMSELALRGLRADAPAVREGFPMLPNLRSDHVITDELVAEYRDGE
ncbi:hypothetical protein [Agromyces neolithicus]|uniref:Antitoxin n=1 Tax=Agromyces neolithicus TaxID=269420 RepID=A0ABN2M0H9_9MICO